VLDRQAEHLRVTAAHWRQAREVERDLGAETYAAIVAAVDSGMSEVQAAKVAGVDRMTVRRALGKL
jgi:DNA invertase Pin-like site-specific DNA recombinase